MEPLQAGIDVDEAEQAHYWLPSLSNSDESLGTTSSEEKKAQDRNMQKRLPGAHSSPQRVSSLSRGRRRSFSNSSAERSASQSKQNRLSVGADNPDHDSASRRLALADFEASSKWPSDEPISPNSSSSRKSKPWGLFRVLVPERSRSSSNLAARANLGRSRTAELSERTCREGLYQTRKSRTSELLELPTQLPELDASGGRSAGSVAPPPPPAPASATAPKRPTLTKSLSHTSLRPLREARDRIVQATSFSFRRSATRDLVQSCRDLDLETSPISMSPLSPLSTPPQWNSGVNGAAASSSAFSVSMGAGSPLLMAPAPAYVPPPCFPGDAHNMANNAMISPANESSSSRDWPSPTFLPADSDSTPATLPLRTFMGSIGNSMAVEDRIAQPATSLRSPGDMLLSGSSHSKKGGERTAAQAIVKGGLLLGTTTSAGSTDVASPLVMQVYQEVEGSVALERLQELDRNGNLAQIPRKAGGELSSVGSILHAEAKCSPCAYWFKGICKYSIGCTYCHYVHEGQKSKRLRASKQTRMRIKRRAEAQEMQSLASLEPLESEFGEEAPDVDAGTSLLQGGFATPGANWAQPGTSSMETSLMAHQSTGSLLHQPALHADAQMSFVPSTELRLPDTSLIQQDQWRHQQRQQQQQPHQLSDLSLASPSHQSGLRLEAHPGHSGLLADLGSPAAPAMLSYTEPLRANAAVTTVAPSQPAYVQPSFTPSLPGTPGSVVWDLPGTPAAEHEWSHWLR